MDTSKLYLGKDHSIEHCKDGTSSNFRGGSRGGIGGLQSRSFASARERARKASAVTH